MKLISTIAIILVFASCNDKKAALVERQHTAAIMLKADKQISETDILLHQAGRISIDSFLVRRAKVVEDSLNWQQVYDSCDRELKKY